LIMIGMGKNSDDRRKSGFSVTDIGRISFAKCAIKFGSGPNLDKQPKIIIPTESSGLKLNSLHKAICNHGKVVII